MKVPIIFNKVNTHIYMDGTYHQLLMGFKNAVYNFNTSVVIIFDGRSGMGKTTLSNQTGIVLDPNFDLPKIYYTPETFLDALANANKGDYICFDEAMLLSNRNAVSAINKMVIIAMSMIRSKQIFVSFCVNSIFDLDRNLAISRADLLCHIYGQNLIDRGHFCAFFKGKDGIDRIKDLYLKGKKYYDYSRPKANLIGSFTPNFIVDQVEYEKRKQDGVNSFLRGTEKPEGKLERKWRMQVIEFIGYLYYNDKLSQEKIGQIGGLAPSIVSDLLEKYRKQHKIVENYGKSSTFDLLKDIIVLPSGKNIIDSGVQPVILPQPDVPT